MNYFIKIVFTLILVGIFIAVGYSVFLGVRALWRKDIDAGLTAKAFLQRFNNPSKKILDDIQEKAQLTITIEKISPTIDIFKQKQLSVHNSEIKGRQQYKVNIKNDSNVEFFDIQIECQFPFAVIENDIISQVKVSDIHFRPSSSRFNIGGSGEVKIYGKLLTPFYDLHIGVLDWKGHVKFITTFDLTNDMWTKDSKHNYFVGTYMRKLNKDELALEIYYPIITKDDRSFYLGEVLHKIPSNLRKGWGFQ